MPNALLASTQLYGPVLAQVLTTGSGLSRTMLTTHAALLLKCWDV
jgi:hypothetical protein